VATIETGSQALCHLSEKATCSAQSRGHRADRDAHDRGGFRRRQSLELTEYEDGSKLFRHPRQNEIESGPGLLLLEEGFRAGASTLELVQCRVDVVQLESHGGAAPIRGDPDGDPAKKRSLPPRQYQIELAGCDDEHLLRSIVELILRDPETSQQAPKKSRVLADELGDTASVAPMLACGVQLGFYGGFLVRHAVVQGGKSRERCRIPRRS
jgi:hypothetical protein